MHTTTPRPAGTPTSPQSDHSPPAPGAGAAPPERRRARQSIAVLVATSLLGLWLGVGAPDVSPAAPPAATPSPAAPAAVVPAPGGQVTAPGNPGRRR